MPHSTGEASQLWPCLAPPPLACTNVAPLSWPGGRWAQRGREAARALSGRERTECGESPPEGLPYRCSPSLFPRPSMAAPVWYPSLRPPDPSQGRDGQMISREPHPLALPSAHFKPSDGSPQPTPGFSASFPMNPETQNLVEMLSASWPQRGRW